MAGKKVGVHGTDAETGRGGGGGGQKKTVCDVTRAQFSELAKPLRILISGPNTGAPEEGEKGEYRTIRLVIPVKRNKDTGEIGFDTGSLGWYGSEKIHLRFGDTEVAVQCGLTLTVVGSKELPKD